MLYLRIVNLYRSYVIGSENFNANRLFALKSQKAAARLMQCA
nr:MAG TPA: hypothetical protein [Caudoviricetes sp.]